MLIKPLGAFGLLAAFVAAAGGSIWAAVPLSAVRAMQDAAPEAVVQVSEEDASALGIAEGDMVEVETRRGQLRAPAKVGDIIPGHVFVPFHYGYWDHDREAEGPRAANELTITAWDPVSKQPLFKVGAVAVKKLADSNEAALAPTVAASAPAEEG